MLETEAAGQCLATVCVGGRVGTTGASLNPSPLPPELLHLPPQGPRVNVVGEGEA